MLRHEIIRHFELFNITDLYKNIAGLGRDIISDNLVHSSVPVRSDDHSAVQSDRPSRCVRILLNDHISYTQLILVLFAT